MNKRKGMIKRLLSIILCIVIAMVLMTGCDSGGKDKKDVANDSAVYGTWTEATFDSGYTFNADGTGLDIFWDLSFTYTAVDGIITVKYDDENYGTAKYTYSIEDSSITMKRQSSDGVSVTYSKTGNVSE